MPKMIQELRHAARVHLKAPGFTLAVVATLALGIGASTIVFSTVNAILLKPLPYPEPQRIVIPWRLAPKDANLGYNEIPWGTVNFQEFLHSRSFQSVAAFKSESFNLTGSGEPLHLEGLRVTSGFFHTLGVNPLLGRVFSAAEDVPGKDRQVILNYRLWQTHFRGDSGILGRSIDLNGSSYSVIGVMPADFEFPRGEEMPGSFDFPRHAQFWIPLALPSVPAPNEPDELAVIARLNPGVTLQATQAEMNLFTASFERRFPDSKGWFNVRVTGLTEQVTGGTRQPLLLILGAVGVLLLVSCVNVATLLLTRSISRRSEFSIREALGAGKATLIRQLLTESLLLSLVSGAAGVVMAAIGLQLVKIFGPSNIPRLQEVRLDTPVMAFALAVALVCSAFFGLAPVAGMFSANLATSLREGVRGGTGSVLTGRLRGVFLVAEIALALVLVIASGLLVRAFLRLLAVDPGFRAERVLTFELSLPANKYKDADHIVGFYQSVLRSIRAIPGVNHAGIVETVPMGGAPDGSLIRLPGRPTVRGKEPFANYNIASPDYFAAAGTPLLRGRGFLDSDTAASTPVVIVSAAMARKFWPREEPIGKQVGIADTRFPAMKIIGVAADVKHVSLREETGPEMYVPFTQKPFPSMLLMHVVLRTSMDSAAAMAGVREEIHRLDADLPVAKVTTLVALLDQSLAGQRFSMSLITVFGLISLLLASIGLYGVISYSVSQRTREIGIRMALGARRSSVIAMVLTQGARLIGTGIATGLLVAMLVTRLLANILYDVPPTDWLTFSTAVPLLACVAIAACWVPALQASRVQPVTALRHE